MYLLSNFSMDYTLSTTSILQKQAHSFTYTLTNLEASQYSYQFSFLPNTIHSWNLLSYDILSCGSVWSFILALSHLFRLFCLCMNRVSFCMFSSFLLVIVEHLCKLYIFWVHSMLALIVYPSSFTPAIEKNVYVV